MPSFGYLDPERVGSSTALWVAGIKRRGVVLSGLDLLGAVVEVAVASIDDGLHPPRCVAAAAAGEGDEGEGDRSGQDSGPGLSSPPTSPGTYASCLKPT